VGVEWADAETVCSECRLPTCWMLNPLAERACSLQVGDWRGPLLVAAWRSWSRAKMVPTTRPVIFFGYFANICMRFSRSLRLC
jgi:hypothetical protein